MKNFDNINVTPELRRAFERASIISSIFDDEYIRTAYVMLSVLLEPKSSINLCLAERGIIAAPDYIVTSMISDRASFELVFGKKAAEKYFAEEEQQEQQESNTQGEVVIEETIVDGEEQIEGEQPEADELKDKVLQVLSEMIVPLVPADQEEESLNLEIIYSDKLEAICEDAATRCMLAKQNFLDMDNLTYSMLQNPNSSGYKMLNGMLEIVELEVSDIIDFIVQNGNIHINMGDEKNAIIIPKNLESCCTVWNNKFEVGVVSDILGRDKEIFKLWNIFSKKTKRNAILLGDAGVGKTAIVEAMVQQIVNGTCPEKFKNYTVLELDVGGTVAGTKYRGELEEKLAKLKKFLENTPNLILFIDEIHQLIGAGSTESSGFDMSGSLKPILARGDVVCVGATTTEEYERFIAKEQAFKRRFEPVIVEEPKHKDVAKMIAAKVESLSKYHGVTFEDGLVDYIIVCASAFNLTGSNPDKSIDLCDRSMAIAEMRGSKVVEKQDVDKVYEENYKKFERWPQKVKESTAYHEAAHYVVSRLTLSKEVEDVIAVSIVPGQDFMGAYIYDINDEAVETSCEYYFDHIKKLLAGRISESLYCKGSYNSGAHSDLGKATSIAKKMVTEYALESKKFTSSKMCDDYVNIYFEGTKDLYGEAIKNELLAEINAIIKSATSRTTHMLKEPDVAIKIKNVANLLLEKKIATAKELEEAFNKE